MPRRLRIEFEGAIHHVMARGSARQKSVRDDADRRRLIAGLETAVVCYGWELEEAHWLTPIENRRRLVSNNVHVRLRGSSRE